MLSRARRFIKMGVPFGTCSDMATPPHGAEAFRLAPRDVYWQPYLVRGCWEYVAVNSRGEQIAARLVGVVLEPDALAGMDCLSAADQSTRTGLISYAVNALRATVSHQASVAPQACCLGRDGPRSRAIP